MSLIACTSKCAHQEEGYCTLARAAAAGVPDGVECCVHFMPQGSALQNGVNGLADVLNLEDG